MKLDPKDRFLGTLLDKLCANFLENALAGYVVLEAPKKQVML